MTDYIDYAITYIRELMDIIRTYKYNVLNGQKFKTFDYNPDDLKVIRLALLSVLFTENFDDLSDNVDIELKRLILSNSRIGKRNTFFNFENGGFYKIGSGINIQSLPPTFNSNDYAKILKMIRNGIAHSKYTYEDGIVKINTYQGQFQVECDVDWLEMMVLCLFSNRQSTTKKGARDVQLELFDEGGLYDLDDVYGFASLVENGDDNKVLMYHKIASKNYLLEQLQKKHAGVIRDDEIEFIENMYKKFNMDVVKINKIENIKEKVLGLQSEQKYKSLTIDKKYIFFGSRLYCSYDQERKNTTAYKNIRNLFEILKGSLDKQHKRICGVGTDFMIDYMDEYMVKCYLNLVYNLLDEKTGINMGSLDANKFNVNVMDNRTVEAHIRNACCHNRIKIVGDDIYIYDKKNDVLNFELRCKIDDLINVTDGIIKDKGLNKTIKIK